MRMSSLSGWSPAPGRMLKSRECCFPGSQWEACFVGVGDSKRTRPPEGGSHPRIETGSPLRPIREQQEGFWHGAWSSLGRTREQESKRAGSLGVSFSRHDCHDYRWILWLGPCLEPMLTVPRHIVCAPAASTLSVWEWVGWKGRSFTDWGPHHLPWLWSQICC